MFRPITVNEFDPRPGPNQLTSRPMNHEVFSLAWAKPSMFATGASGLREPKRLTNSNLEFLGKSYWMGWSALVSLINLLP